MPVVVRAAAARATPARSGLRRRRRDAQECVPAAAIDAASLERIVGNLVDNGLAHGRPPVTIKVGLVTTTTGGWVRLEVADGGDGMPPELLATATGRFTRAPEARPRPGAGLGLSLVKGIVEGVGGELRLCHAGRHEHAGGLTTDAPCEHGTAMTVTVLVPAYRTE